METPFNETAKPLGQYQRVETNDLVGTWVRNSCAVVYQSSEGKVLGPTYTEVDLGLFT